MKPTIISHPFRTILLGYNSEAPLSAFEQDAIEKYTLLHNESYEFKQLLTRLLDYYTSAKALQEQCHTDYNKLQNEYMLVAPMLQYFEKGQHLSEFELEIVPEEERVGYDTQPLFAQLNIFQHTYTDYIQRLKAAEKDHTNMTQQLEKLEQQFDEFEATYFSPIIKNYAQMEIDTVSLDEDFDNFRGAFSELYQLDDQLCDARNAFIEAHNPLFEQIAALDKQLVNFFETLRKVDEERERIQNN
jgi:hypothetical protein